MEPLIGTPAQLAQTRLLVEQVLRTGLMLVDLFGDLVEQIPDDAFPGEEPGEVLVEMLTGTAHPVAMAAGDRTVEQTVALLGAITDRTLADLKAAARLAQRD
jgi:hypothetical protein